MAIAPLTCSCGEALGLVHETADTDSNGGAVFVGKLVCAAGHSWIDIRPADEDRPHRKAPKAWQRKDPTMAKTDKHKFHVVLTGGVGERDFTGTDARVDSAGALVIFRGDAPLVIYASGEWQLCELESQDDKG
jgi:hypothetical protein